MIKLLVEQFIKNNRHFEVKDDNIKHYYNKLLQLDHKNIIY